jgi:hypothetical protein
MTCPLIPHFIFKMFEKEVVKINITIIEKICRLYNLDIDEVKSQLTQDININFNIIDENIEQVKIIKKHVNNKTDNEQEIEKEKILCDARIYNASDLVVKQCSRSRMKDCNFCKLHQRLHEEGNLKYGTINDEKPECISTAKLNMKVKRKIY